MIFWSRALVVTDGSPQADMTIQYALTLAQADDLDVLLLHVKAAWSPGDTQQDKARAKDICTLAAAHAAAAGVSYDVQAASGRAVSAILQAAAQAQCDVIILGVPEGTCWQQFRGGHTTRAVLAKAPCPVLLVPSLPGLPCPEDSESSALRPHPKGSMSRLLSGSWKFPKKS
jgi:nucleotide-binding universal stress UspA family protein